MPYRNSMIGKRRQIATIPEKPSPSIHSEIWDTIGETRGDLDPLQIPRQMPNSIKDNVNVSD